MKASARLLLPRESALTPADRSLAVADAVNLFLLLLGMTFYWRLSASHLADEGVESGLYALVFYLAQGAFLWYLAAQGTALVPLGKKAARLLYSAAFTLVCVALLLNYQCYALMRVHIDPSLALLVLEPGFLADLTFEISQIAVLLLFVSAFFGAQFALASLPLPENAVTRCVSALRRSRVKLLIAAGFFSVWTVWSYENFVHHADANKQVQAAPLFVPRTIDLGLAEFWAALGVEPAFAPLESTQILAQHDSLGETGHFRAFREKLTLPARLEAEKDWNVLILAAESWRWDMFNPEVMPRLWAIAQRRGWVSPAHYSTGNSTAEGLYGLLSGQTPFYWFTSYRYRLNPVFFDVLKRLGYRTNALASSNLRYRGMDRYIFGPHFDSLDILRVPPPQMTTGEPSTDGQVAAPEHAERTRKDLWDLAVAERYLESLKRRDGSKRFDFLFFYSTHYRYHYPPAFERFGPVVDADFVLFNFYLKMMAPQLLNRYRNASHYLDYLFARIVGELERSGELERTIVVITGDHGEEFFEKGRFGHSMSLNDYQTRVPLLLFLPERARIDYTVTSHADIVPTILAALGTEPSVEQLFTGKNLFRHLPDRNAAVVMSLMNRGAPMEFALVRENRKFHFLNRRDGLAPFGTPKDARGRLLDRATVDAELRYLLALKRHFATGSPALFSSQLAGEVRQGTETEAESGPAPD